MLFEDATELMNDAVSGSALPDVKRSNARLADPGFTAKVISERFCALGQDGKHARLGLMGGTFDPIHFGHLNCAERVREALNLDGVLFIPAGNPVFKQDREIVPAAARFAMCKLAVTDNPYFDVSDIEIRRQGITFTVDTLEELHKVFPSCVEFVFIVGSDSVSCLSEWKDVSRLSSLAKFVCVVRPGYTPDEKRLKDLSEIGFHIDILEALLMDVSSSDIRRRCADGKSIRYMTPFSVMKFIHKNKLYGAR